MDVAKASNIMDGYVGWWRAQVGIHQEGDAVRIVCPMLDRNNDHMSIYLADDPDGGYLLTDLGATIGDLAMSGCDVLGTDSRARKLQEVLSGFGVSRDQSELYRRTSEGGLFQSINMLMQSMARVDDLFFTAKENARSFFLDDVRVWLDAHGIRYTDNVVYLGRSGFESRFDFCIPKTAGKAPERLVKTVSTPTESSVKNALFGWQDIIEARPNSSGYLFLNMVDNAGGVCDVDPSLEAACRAYKVKAVSWAGSADSVLEELVA